MERGSQHGICLLSAASGCAVNLSSRGLHDTESTMVKRTRRANEVGSWALLYVLMRVFRVFDVAVCMLVTLTQNDQSAMRRDTNMSFQIIYLYSSSPFVCCKNRSSLFPVCTSKAVITVFEKQS